MEYIGVIIIAALVFLVCFAIDKLFTRIFRSQSQHRSGEAVRLSKRYGSIGLLLACLGVAMILAGIGNQAAVLIICGVLLLVVGGGLVVYYLSYGIFYDDESFVLTNFGKKSVTYRYGDILGQKLYASAGNVTLIEIYMRDGKTFQVQSAMGGAYGFMDKAFAGWLAQTGKTQQECPFYDPQNCCWFPPVEE